MNEERPEPGHPPVSYELEGATAVFYRRVSEAERASLRLLGRFAAPPCGIPQGKHLTTSPELAWAWGKRMLAVGWENSAGSVVKVRLAATVAQGVHFVGARTDGIGACYFATLDELDGAEISELDP